MISSDWSDLCEGSAIYYYLFFLSGFADGIGWELGRMSLQYPETFSWCLRWFFPALSCLSYSTWEMDTLNQVKTLTRTGFSLQRHEIINVSVLQKYHIRRIPLLVASKILFTLYWVWWLISYLALPDTSTERDLQKVLQQLEPQISFLEELTKMGGAMRTVLTKILTNQQAFKELCMGKYLNYTVCVWTI